VRLPGGDASAFAQVAIRHGVSVIPGPLVSPNGAGGDRFRLPFVADPEVLETAVELLARAWRSFQLRSA
jgi:hypothetical protein